MRLCLFLNKKETTYNFAHFQNENNEIYHNICMAELHRKS